MPSYPRLNRAFHVASALAGAAVSMYITACAKTAPTSASSTPVASLLSVVQGNFQSAEVGFVLATPIVLRVTDKTGAGVAGVPVTLSIGLGGGSVSPASAVSDSKGQITSLWTLGPGIVAQTLVADAPGVDPVTLEASGILPTTIIIAQGNNQTGKVTGALTNSIVIRVVGPENEPMAGVTVALQITTGGGAITPQSSVTNALGETTVKWTMGALPGPNTALVMASTLSPVILSATATP